MRGWNFTRTRARKSFPTSIPSEMRQKRRRKKRRRKKKKKKKRKKKKKKKELLCIRNKNENDPADLAY